VLYMFIWQTRSCVFVLCSKLKTALMRRRYMRRKVLLWYVSGLFRVNPYDSRTLLVLVVVVVVVVAVVVVVVVVVEDCNVDG